MSRFRETGESNRRDRHAIERYAGGTQLQQLTDWYHHAGMEVCP
jgi:hypothetical protein